MIDGTDPIWDQIMAILGFCVIINKESCMNVPMSQLNLTEESAVFQAI